MLMYTLIGLCLVLTGVAGLQFTYLFYMDKINRDRMRHVRQVEARCTRLTDRLRSAEQRIAEKDDLIESLCPGLSGANETWAEVIDER